MLAQARSAAAASFRAQQLPAAGVNGLAWVQALALEPLRQAGNGIGAIGALTCKGHVRRHLRLTEKQCKQ